MWRSLPGVSKKRGNGKIPAGGGGDSSVNSTLTDTVVLSQQFLTDVKTPLLVAVGKENESGFDVL
jgi:hypothetical protein